MTVRQRGLPFRSDIYNINIDWPGGPVTSHSADSSTLQWADTFVGIQNPRWRAEIKNLISATTPASGRKYNVSNPYADATIEFEIGSLATSNYRSRYQSYLGPPQRWIPSSGSLIPFNVDTNSLNHVTAQVNSKFVDRVKSAISSFQSGQDIIELHQTIESIIHPMKSLRAHVSTYFRDLKKIKDRFQKMRISPAKRSVGLSKALADTYLEWTFGWNPLSADIAAGIVDLSRERLSSAAVHASGKILYKGSDGRYPVNGTTAYLTGHQVVTSEYSIRLKGSVDVYYSKQPRLLRELQLLPEDFVPTAWNVLPYSFVCDYFLNIGDIIDAASLPSAAVRWINRTTRDTTSYVVGFSQDQDRIKSDFINLGWTVKNQELHCANFEVEIVNFNRDSMTPADLVPPLVIEIPPLSSKPWRNIVALIAGSQRLVTPFR
jgi:hypothetical protein